MAGRANNGCVGFASNPNLNALADGRCTIYGNGLSLFGAATIGFVGIPGTGGTDELEQVTAAGYMCYKRVVFAPKPTTTTATTTHATTTNPADTPTITAASGSTCSGSQTFELCKGRRMKRSNCRDPDTTQWCRLCLDPASVPDGCEYTASVERYRVSDQTAMNFIQCNGNTGSEGGGFDGLRVTCSYDVLAYTIITTPLATTSLPPDKSAANPKPTPTPTAAIQTTTPKATTKTLSDVPGTATTTAARGTSYDAMASTTITTQDMASAKKVVKLLKAEIAALELQLQNATFTDDVQSIATINATITAKKVDLKQATAALAGAQSGAGSAGGGNNTDEGRNAATDTDAKGGDQNDNAQDTTSGGIELFAHMYSPCPLFPPTFVLRGPLPCLPSSHVLVCAFRERYCVSSFLQCRSAHT